MISKRRARTLMKSSNVSPLVVMRICGKQKIMDPLEYFARAVMTEWEHGQIGEELGTNVVGVDDVMAAKIALAHLFGVEFGKPSEEWEECPYYYHELWKMEKRCAGPERKRQKRNGAREFR